MGSLLLRGIALAIAECSVAVETMVVIIYNVPTFSETAPCWLTQSSFHCTITTYAIVN